MIRSVGQLPAIIAAASLIAACAQIATAQADIEIAAKQETFRLLPAKEDPGFGPQLRRTLAALSDADPRQRQAATRVLAHSTSLSVDDLLGAVTPDVSLEIRWRMLEAARMRFERSERAALGVQFGSFDGMTAVERTVVGFDCNDRSLLLPGDTIVSIAGVPVIGPPSEQRPRTTSVVGSIQPAIIAHDPGDRVAIVVSRVTDPKLRPKPDQITPLQQVRPERHPDQSALDRTLVTIEVELGSFGNLSNVGTRGPDRSAIDSAWEHRLARDGVGLGINTLKTASEDNVVPALLPAVNVADAFSEFRSIFLAASELPFWAMPEMLPDRRDTENDRRRFIAGRAQVQLNQRINFGAPDEGGLREDPLSLPGGAPEAAAAMSARPDVGSEDPRTASLIMHAAQLQRDIEAISERLNAIGLNDPARATLQARAVSLRDQLSHARTELAAMPDAGGPTDPRSGVELTERVDIEHDADS